MVSWYERMAGDVGGLRPYLRAKAVLSHSTVLSVESSDRRVDVPEKNRRCTDVVSGQACVSFFRQSPPDDQLVGDGRCG